MFFILVVAHAGPFFTGYLEVSYWIVTHVLYINILNILTYFIKNEQKKQSECGLRAKHWVKLGAIL